MTTTMLLTLAIAINATAELGAGTSARDKFTYTEFMPTTSTVFQQSYPSRVVFDFDAGLVDANTTMAGGLRLDDPSTS